jgi:hypothetical protein
MLRLIDEQLGRILLVIAVLGAVVAAWTNQARRFEEIPKNTRSVQVELDKSALTATANEVFFLADDGTQYSAGKPIFQYPKLVKAYQPVELGLPPADVMRPPQILPEPGPALEGTAKLPRFGDEFPPVGGDEKPPAGQTDQPKGPPKAPGGAAPPPGKADTKTSTKAATKKDF